jgi:PIN domain nuclease of toxin-antitoxin system
MALIHGENGQAVVAAALAGRSAISIMALSIEGMTEADCVDRVCLVLAARQDVPALTTDRAWADADVKADVQLIR